MIETILNSFALVALSEMGDKTQLLAFSLATRFKKPLPILAGIFTATILNHALASSLGSWISANVPEFWMALVLGVTFIAFGLWTLKPDSFEETESSDARGSFLTTTVLFFLAEMGDKTQLATVALAARFHDAVSVTVGTTLGMMLSDGIAVFTGEKLTQWISMQKIRWVAASLFFLFGVLTLARLF